MKSIAHRISEFNRIRKWNIFNANIKYTDSTSLLDVGYSDVEYSPTDNFIEKKYPHPQNITALGVETPILFPERYPEVKVVHYDGDIFPFADKSFDVCWSNAVIEHVGGREKQLLFLKELNRVGKQSFITTPNRYFPIEVHTRTPLLHFLPKKIFYKFLSLTGRKWATGDYMNLLSYSDIKSLLKESKIDNYQIKRNRLFFFTLDFIIIF